MSRSLIAAIGAVCVSSCTLLADVAAIAPAADAFVASSQAASNYGGGGSLAVSSASAPKGEFQTVLRFNTAPAAAQFDASLGAGLWIISAASLHLTAALPNNNLFNTQAAGQFAVSWLANDTWVEGSGTPAQPGVSGLTFTSLPSFLGATDEPLGTFAFGGQTSGTTSYPLSPGPGFAAELANGGIVSLRVSPVGTSVAFLFNSRTHSAVTQPVLELVAVARCPADFDRSGALGVQDIFDFLNAWFLSDPRTDFNATDGVSVQDIFDFLNAWFAGCP